MVTDMAANSRFAVAVHILAALAYLGGTHTSAELARSVRTNPVVVRRIMARLARAKLVTAQSGAAGGFTLARNARDITLLDVQRALDEGGLFAVHQNRREPGCPVSCHLKSVLSDVFQTAEDAAGSELAKVRLSNVLDRIRRLDARKVRTS